MADDGVSAATAWALIDILKPKAVARQPDGVATVTRVDKDGTVWVRLSNSTIDTPANGSVVSDVTAGDSVSYKVESGKLSITGNLSDPAVGREAATNVAAKVVGPVRRLAGTAQQAADAAERVAKAIRQHFWHDDNGAHISSEAGDAEGAQNALWNSLGMLFRAGADNLLAIVTGSDPGVDVYDGQGSAGSNIIAALHGSGLRMGRASESHMDVDYHSMSMTDSGGTEYLRVSDLRDRTGYATVKHPFYGDGTTRDFAVSMPATSTESVTVDGEPANYYYQNQSYRLTPAPADGALVLITYKTNVNWAKAFTFGIRNSSYDPATGDSFTPIGPYSAAFGVDCTADGYASFAAGDHASANGDYSAAFGHLSRAAANAFATAGGQAAGVNSAAFGGEADGESSFAACSAFNEAKGIASSVFGHGTIASGDYQTALGAWNEEDANGDYALIIGNGTDDSNRSNAFTVDWNGIINAGTDETQVAISSDVRTVNHNVVHSNGVCCSVTLNVRNDAAIANGGSMSVGTVPDGYRPAFTVYAACSSGSAGGMGCYMSLTSAGVVTLYNRSGASVAANTVLAATLTYAL